MGHGRATSSDSHTAAHSNSRENHELATAEAIHCQHTNRRAQSLPGEGGGDHNTRIVGRQAQVILEDGGLVVAQHVDTAHLLEDLAGGGEAGPVEEAQITVAEDVQEARLTRQSQRHLDLADGVRYGR